MSRFLSLYNFYDELEMRDAGYEYRFPKITPISWSEEDSPQWAYMGEGRTPLCKFHYITEEEAKLRGFR